MLELSVVSFTGQSVNKTAIWGILIQDGSRYRSTGTFSFGIECHYNHSTYVLAEITARVYLPGHSITVQCSAAKRT